MKISDTLRKDPKMKITLIINSCAIQVHNENHHKVCGPTVTFFHFQITCPLEDQSSTTSQHQRSQYV